MTLTEFSYCKILGMTPFERKKDENTFIFSIMPEAAELPICANAKGGKEVREHPIGLQETTRESLGAVGKIGQRPNMSEKTLEGAGGVMESPPHTLQSQTGGFQSVSIEVLPGFCISSPSLCPRCSLL